MVVRSESSAGGATVYSTRGIYGLKKCHDPEDAVADIVFVHGLTGNRESTWTDKESGTFWPAQLLPKDVPKARIMTFGYDADVVHFWAMASQNRIGDHASNLVNSLAQLRERTETEDRPIVFVTHSLGGLVFEDAMLLSKNSAEKHIRSLVECTNGVCFLGTPHCGASTATWASIFGSLMNALKTTNVDILDVLRSNSQVLSRIQSQFHTMLRANKDQGREMKITCFFEEFPVRGVGEIVPKSSSILPGYNNMGIHANHIDMTKFASDEDPGYLNVSTEIMRWIRSVQSAPQQVVQVEPVVSTDSIPRSPAAGELAPSQNTSTWEPGSRPRSLTPSGSLTDDPRFQLGPPEPWHGYNQRGNAVQSPPLQTQVPHYNEHLQRTTSANLYYLQAPKECPGLSQPQQAHQQCVQSPRNYLGHSYEEYRQAQQPSRAEYSPQQYPPPGPEQSPQPHPQPQASPITPQQGNPIFNNYGNTGKMVNGSVFNGNITF